MGRQRGRGGHLSLTKGRLSSHSCLGNLSLAHFMTEALTVTCTTRGFLITYKSFSVAVLGAKLDAPACLRAMISFWMNGLSFPWTRGRYTSTTCAQQQAHGVINLDAYHRCTGRDLVLVSRTPIRIGRHTRYQRMGRSPLPCGRDCDLCWHSRCQT